MESGEKHIPGLGVNVCFGLYDNTSRILWSSKNVHVGDRLLDMVAKENRAEAETVVQRCIVLREPGEIRLAPPPDNPQAVVNVSLMPVEILGIAAIGYVIVLPQAPPPVTDEDVAVLRMLAEDYTLKQIATELERSESAIDARVRALKSKMGRTTLSGLVGAAVRFRII